MSWIKAAIAVPLLAWLPSLQAQTTISAPGVTQTLVGDFNGDGKQDLLIGQSSLQGGFTISVFLGHGDGTFSAPVITSNANVDPAASVTAAADFDSDGKLDLILHVPTGEGAWSFIALGNGDGSFRHDLILINQETLAVAVADFNGDGKPDLLAITDIYTSPPTVGFGGFVVFGNGDATFVSGTGTAPYNLQESNALAAPAAVGDVNLDGKADVVTAAAVYLSNGDGTFQQVPWSNSAEMLDSNPAGASAVIADVNGDGNPDIVYTAAVGSGISLVVLFGNGDGTFRLGDFYELGPAGYYSLVVADFNQDGAPDIAAASAAGGLTILANYGDGTFHSSVSVNGLSLGSKVLSGPMTLADFNGDGKPDLVVMDQPTASGSSVPTEVSVLLNSAPVVFPVLLGGVVNAASDSHAPVSPGSLASAYTLPQPYQPAQATTLPLPLKLGDHVGLELGYVRVPLLSISPIQINFQVPWELPEDASTSLAFQADNGQIYTFPPPAWDVSISTFSPGIFTMSGRSTGQGAVTISNSSTIAAPAGAFPGSAPATRGQYVTILCTGLGPVTNQPASGAAALADPLSITKSTPKVTIGGAQALVQFSGLAPGLVGVDQVNAQIPANSAVGPQVPLVIQTADGSTSNTVTIAVQ